MNNLPKEVQNVAKNYLSPEWMVKYFKRFAEVEKFRQIWSHCLREDREREKEESAAVIFIARRQCDQIWQNFATLAKILKS